MTCRPLAIGLALLALAGPAAAQSWGPYPYAQRAPYYAAQPRAPYAGAARRAEQALLEVRRVQVRRHRDPGMLLVIIDAVAPTPGYSGFRLRPVQYIQAPPDGVYDFTLVGVPPPGFVAQVVTPVTITLVLPCSQDLRGVRVHARGSSAMAWVPRAW